MTIQDLGSLGELIAAIATVVTLAYLAFQIRQSTNVARAAALQSTVQFSSGLVESLYRDPDLAILFDRGREDMSSLSEAERSRFFYIMLGFVRRAQSAHYQFELGFMSDEVWEGYAESILRWMDPPGSREWWRENAGRFSKSFRLFMDRELERRTA